MKYKEIKIYTDVKKLDSLVELLASHDITDIIINDPRDAEYFDEKKSYEWDYVSPDVIALLNSGAFVCIYRDLDFVLPNYLHDYEISSAIVDEEDWLHKWEEYFVPAKITENIVVKPLWREYEAKTGETVIEIDPGMAFGTGTHPTTAMCIKHLEKYLKPEDKVLDVGCGTGILSIAAAKIGSKDVLAVDLDPEAVISTKRNAQLNHCEECMDIRIGDLTKGLDYKADVVVANLMADLVIMLSKDVEKHCNENAMYITSGILDEKEEIVSKSIIEAGFEIIEVLHEKEWCAIAARKITSLRS